MAIIGLTMTMPLYTIKKGFTLYQKTKIYIYTVANHFWTFDYLSRLNDDGRAKIWTDQLMSPNHIWSRVSHEAAVSDVGLPVELTLCCLW